MLKLIYTKISKEFYRDIFTAIGVIIDIMNFIGDFNGYNLQYSLEIIIFT